MSFTTAIQALQDQGVPTASYIQAVRYLQRDDLNEERPDLRQEEYHSRIKQITGTPIQFDDPRESKYAYLYIVQELIKANAGISNLTDLQQVVHQAMIETQKFIKDNQYYWDSLQNKDDDTPRVRADGSLKPKKGGLKEQAEQVFCEQFTGVGLREIRHYEPLIKKETDETKLKELKAKLKPFQQAAKEERKKIIKLFTGEVGLTEKGAPTYFYNCKKKYEDGELTLKSGD